MDSSALGRLDLELLQDQKIAEFLEEPLITLRLSDLHEIFEGWSLHTLDPPRYDKLAEVLIFFCTHVEVDIAASMINIFMDFLRDHAVLSETILRASFDCPQVASLIGMPENYSVYTKVGQING